MNCICMTVFSVCFYLNVYFPVRSGLNWDQNPDFYHPRKAIRNGKIVNRYHISPNIKPFFFLLLLKYCFLGKKGCLIFGLLRISMKKVIGVTLRTKWQSWQRNFLFWFSQWKNRELPHIQAYMVNKEHSNNDCQFRRKNGLLSPTQVII
jgi:hypothetical protein